jgi:hypothetical protein
MQLSILKILAGQPEGRASLEAVKHYLAVFYSSGPEWTARMKRLAQRAPGIDIFTQKLVVREPGEWRITDAGRAMLAALELPSAALAEAAATGRSIVEPPAAEPSWQPLSSKRRIADHRLRRVNRPRKPTRRRLSA